MLKRVAIDSGLNQHIVEHRYMRMYQLPDFPQHGIKIAMTKCNPGTTFKKAIDSRIAQQKAELALNQPDYIDSKMSVE